tara:strand:- start:172 stop:363 length:192 start_codon:yes stop_codon:yes gene_type:complete
MTSDKHTKAPRKTVGGEPAHPGAADKSQDPDWANGLRRLYDSVVEEPLPDSFQDLLDQLDSKA